MIFKEGFRRYAPTSLDARRGALANWKARANALIWNQVQNIYYDLWLSLYTLVMNPGIFDQGVPKIFIFVAFSRHLDEKAAISCQGAR